MGPNFQSGGCVLLDRLEARITGTPRIPLWNYLWMLLMRSPKLESLRWWKEAATREATGEEGHDWLCLQCNLDYRSVRVRERELKRWVKPLKHGLKGLILAKLGDEEYGKLNKDLSFLEILALRMDIEINVSCNSRGILVPCRLHR